MIGAGFATILSSALCLGMTSATALADHPLEPDLVTVDLRAAELEVSQAGKQTLLRLANRVGNTGEGPLEVRPSSDYQDCDGDGDSTDELIGYQWIYEHSWAPGSDENVHDETDVGCVTYHAVHTHWHVAKIARYSLIEEETGKLKDGNKVGFCLGDSDRIDGILAPGFYSFGGCGSSTTLPTVTGISPGFFDLYTAATAGQRVNVTGLEPGRYCLRSVANPDGTLVESDASNNLAEMRIRLNPEREVVRKISRNCQLPR